MLKRFTSSVDRVFRSRLPGLYFLAVQRPKIFLQFKTEKKLSRGIQLSKSSKPSILFFTTQKCASRYVSRVIATLAQPVGLVHADYDAYVTMVPLPNEHNPFRPDGNLDIAFRPHGYYYGPIGSFRAIPNLKEYRILLQLRDPRDVLTSLYFSTAFSHALINRKMISRRQQAQQMSIDEYVLKMAEEYRLIYQTYWEKLIGQTNVLFLKYEDMVANFDPWLNSLCHHLGLNDQIRAIDNIRAQANFSLRAENQYSQRRQITPGDHKRKLQQQTIEELSATFSQVLNNLGYAG